jgi:hypothetical protein
VLDRHSFLQGVAAERRRQFAETTALRNEMETLKAEALAALMDARAVKLEYLNFKAAVVHDKQQLAEIARQRMFVQAQIAQRDPTVPLH